MIQVDKMVFLAQKGDPYARSALLASNRRLVKKTASGICNRFLQWNKDRELEIAINAFDEAIDIFPRQKEDDFLCFAHSLICLRVYEHLESEGKISDLNIPFKEDERIADLLQKPNYADREKKIARLWEKYRDVMEEYGISYIDLFGGEEKQISLASRLAVMINSARCAMRKYWDDIKEAAG